MSWYDDDEQKMVGKVLKSWENRDDEFLDLEFTDGTEAYFYHSQDCCEYVRITKCPSLDDYIGHELTAFYHDSTDGADEDYYESATTTSLGFTFDNGFVFVEWVGTSNGYYSEDVSFSIH
jgi:hypothetical protein